MGTLKTELKRLNIAGSVPSRRARKKQPRPQQDVKGWQSAHDWSEVEKELLESQAQARRSR